MKNHLRLNSAKSGTPLGLTRKDFNARARAVLLGRGANFLAVPQGFPVMLDVLWGLYGMVGRREISARTAACRTEKAYQLIFGKPCDPAMLRDVSVSVLKTPIMLSNSAKTAAYRRFGPSEALKPLTEAQLEKLMAKMTKNPKKPTGKFILAVAAAKGNAKFFGVPYAVFTDTSGNTRIERVTIAPREVWAVVWPSGVVQEDRRGNKRYALVKRTGNTYTSQNPPTRRKSLTEAEMAKRGKKSKRSPGVRRAAVNPGRSWHQKQAMKQRGKKRTSRGLESAWHMGQEDAHRISASVSRKRGRKNPGAKMHLQAAAFMGKRAKRFATKKHLDPIAGAWYSGRKFQSGVDAVQSRQLGLKNNPLLMSVMNPKGKMSEKERLALAKIMAQHVRGRKNPAKHSGEIRRGRGPLTMDVKRPSFMPKSGVWRPNPSQLAQMQKDPKFRQALALYRQFHGNDPVEMRREIIHIGGKKITGREYFVGMGGAIDATYAPFRHSGKGPHRFRHLYDKRPLKVVSADGRTIMDLPGSYKVTDWIRG